MVDVDCLLWGDHPDPGRHARRFVGGFAALALAGYALFAVASRPPVDTVVGTHVTGTLFAVVTFYAPPLAAAASTARRGGLLAAVGVGVVPAAVFAAVASLLALAVGPTGDSPAWALAAAYAMFGVVGAVAGYVVVAAGRLARRRYRAR